VTARLLIVVSGLAASGKTTVGRALGAALSLPLLDKDDILEALFDSLGCEDRGRRQQLSRASDDVLLRIAAASDVAVVVNWWNHDTAPAMLASAAESLVEVHCKCPVEVAASRFALRERHPGHLDRFRTAEEHEAGIRRLRESYRGPLGLEGPLVVVDTSGPVDEAALVAGVRPLVERHGAVGSGSAGNRATDEPLGREKLPAGRR
jgi:predicted kinase